jgi:hypothetical protein
VVEVEVVYFPGLALPGPGRYVVEVLLDGTPVHAYGLHVMGPSEEGEDEQG